MSPTNTPSRLPISREHSFINVMMRDADWAYVYWELTADDVENALQTLKVSSAHAHLTLRLSKLHPPNKDSSQPPTHKFTADEFAVDEWLGSRYLLLGHPGALHSIELGFRSDTGDFHTIVQSPWKNSPRSTPVTQAMNFVSITRGADELGNATLKVSLQPTTPQDTPQADPQP